MNLFVLLAPSLQYLLSGFAIAAVKVDPDPLVRTGEVVVAGMEANKITCTMAENIDERVQGVMSRQRRGLLSSRRG